MMKTKLARAIAMTLAGGALSLGAVSSASAASTTMYNGNKYDSAASNTDGWVYGFDGTLAQGTRGGSYASPITSVNFVGTASTTTTPFGYQGNSHLNWAVEFTGGGVQAAEISDADALTRYSYAAEVDTGAGAWQDVASTPDTGWKHQTDIGIIKTAVDSYITLNLTRMTAPSTPNLVNDNFGVTVFTGMDTNTGNYSHHGAWNCPTCASPSLYTKNNPFGTTGLTYLTHDASVDTLNSMSFLALAGQVYSVYLGGAGVGLWSQNVSDYKLSITASQVPVPAAAWLFGGALMSLFGANRRKKVLPA